MACPLSALRPWPVAWTRNLRGGLSCHQFLERRWYGLPKAVTGERSWSKNRETRRNKRSKDKVLPTFDELIERPMANLKHCRYARATRLNKVYDICMTSEELEKAEKLLIAYRHGLNFPRSSLPMVVTRACIRVGKPERALHYAKNKVQFGVFPTRKLYNVLMDACLKIGNHKGAMSAYKLILADDWTPDGMTYHMAARASLQLEMDRAAKGGTGINKSVEETKDETDSKVESPKDETDSQVDNDGSDARLNLTGTLDFCDKCFGLEPKLGTKTYRVVVWALLSNGYTVEAGELIESLQASDKLPKQTIFNLKLDLFTDTLNYAGALSLLKTLCSRDSQDIGIPKKGLPRLRQAIADTKDDKLLATLDTICSELESRSDGNV